MQQRLAMKENRQWNYFAVEAKKTSYSATMFDSVDYDELNSIQNYDLLTRGDGFL